MPLNMNAKPEPLLAEKPRPCCPVCGTVSYSRAGIHPQCAVKAADGVRDRRLSARKAAAEAAAAANPASGPRRFERVCPKCRAIQHVRRRTCECGHVL